MKQGFGGLWLVLWAGSWVGCQRLQPVDDSPQDANAVDAGTFDAGPLPLEICDGLDNDFDGLIDRAPDGGPLTSPCPLTRGVCASTRSVCIDAGWTTCSYGPDYERTERRCDRLDNDCDGRVDTSWKRTLLEGDAGSHGTLFAADIELAQLVPGSSGHWLSLPDNLLIINDDLEVTTRTQFPHTWNANAYVFPNGSERIRISFDSPLGFPGAPARVVAHLVRADGSFPTEPDGGVHFFGEARWPGFFGPRIRAGARDGGWTAIAANQTHSDRILGGWITLESDGGFDQGFIDAGIPSMATGSVWMTGSGLDVLLVDYHYPFGFNAFVIDANAATLRFASPDCNELMTASPLTYACIDPSTSLTSWREEAGALLTAPFRGRPLGDHASSSRQLVLTWEPALDGGNYPERAALNELRDGGLVPYVVVAGGPLNPRYLYVYDLGGRLQLLAWGDNVTSPEGCPNCVIERFSAEYVCAP